MKRSSTNAGMIKKLLMAINSKGGRILYKVDEWWSNKENRVVKKYTIKKAILDETTGKNNNVELFTTHSHIQVVLFLRDYLFAMQGLDIPKDNEQWEDCKQRMNIDYLTYLDS